MKLKNSHVLLIVMSIFLLVSIGSVCASDTAMDADAQLADDGSSVVLSDGNTTQKIDTTVVSKDVKINEGETAKLDVNVKDNESNDVNFTKDEINITEEKTKINFDYTNSSIILTDKLSAGNHSLIINYLGNANYTNSSTKILLSIVGNYTLSTPSSVNFNSANKVVIPINLTDSVNNYDINPSDLTLTISYMDGNDTLSKNVTEFDLVDGKINFNYDLSVNTCTLIINYPYENKTLTRNVTLNKVINGKIIPLNLEAEYASGYFTFKLIDVDTNETLANKKLSYTIITGSINTAGSVNTNASGIASIDNSRLTVYKFDNGTISSDGHISVGKQLFSIKGDDSSISASEIKDNFTVVKASINIVINPYTEEYKSDEKVVINVTNEKTGEAMRGVILHLNMPNTTSKDYYFQTDDNGTSQINVSGLISGTYKLSVSNNDTDNINYKNASGTITILKAPVKVTATVKAGYYNSDTTATIKVTDKKTGEALSNVYVLVQLFTGKTSANYLFATNDKGEITFSAPLSVGSHKMVVSLAYDTRYDGEVTKTITVKKATGKFSVVKSTVYYKDYLTIKLTNTKNKNPIYAAKVNINVFVSSNRYYKYSGTTGADGRVNLQIELNPGTYKIEVSAGESKNYTASKLTKKISVKKASATLTPKKLSSKKGVSKYFQVTVKNKQTKNLVVGAKIKIKVYTGKSYKTYTAKTNSKGIAKINVKSLKVGTHKVVVSSGEKYIAAKTATSSIKITKK